MEMRRFSFQVKTKFIKNQNLNLAPEHRLISLRSIHPMETAINTRMIDIETEMSAETTVAIVIEKVNIIDPVQKTGAETIIDNNIQTMYQTMVVTLTLHPFLNLLICKTEIGNVFSVVIGIGPREAIVINVRKCKLRRKEITVGYPQDHNRMTDVKIKIIDKEVKVVAVGVLRVQAVVAAVRVKGKIKVEAIVVTARVKMVIGNNRLIADYRVKRNKN
jgi:hypothetical protein